MNILNLITPLSNIIQNNHTVKKTILESLGKDYKIFKKFEFYNDISNELNKNPDMSEADLKRIFFQNIIDISKTQSKKIFSSRLINNSLEFERIPRRARKEEDINFIKQFNQFCETNNPSTPYLAEAAKRESVTFKEIENNIEKIFNKLIKTGDLTINDIEDIIIFSKIQTYRNKKEIIYSITNTIDEYNINVDSLKSKDIYKLRENVFRHQLSLKNATKLITYTHPHLIEGDTQFWLGDCDTLYNETSTEKRVCYCSQCENEDTSICLWQAIPIHNIDSATMFLTPNLICHFNTTPIITKDKDYKAYQNYENHNTMIKEKWNENALINSIFHILIPETSQDQLYTLVIDLIKKNNLYSYPINHIQNLYKVEQFLGNINKSPEKKLSSENRYELQQMINLINNGELTYIDFDVHFDFIIKVDNFFREKKIHIYEDFHKHPEHVGLYISKRIKLYSKNYYSYYLSKGQ